MKNTTHISLLYTAIVILISTLFVTQCTKSKDFQEITTPEYKDILKSTNPELVKPDTVFIKQYRDTLLEYYNPVDTVYIEKYINATDNKKASLYLDAIGKRKYKDTVEDDRLKIEYTAETEGKLLNIDFDYTIKSQTIELPKIKKDVFTLYGGAGLSTTKDLNILTPTVNLGFKGTGDNIYYLNYGYDKSIQAGIMFKIGSIKK